MRETKKQQEVGTPLNRIKCQSFQKADRKKDIKREASLLFLWYQKGSRGASEENLLAGVLDKHTHKHTGNHIIPHSLPRSRCTVYTGRPQVPVTMHGSTVEAKDTCLWAARALLVLLCSVYGGRWDNVIPPALTDHIHNGKARVGFKKRRGQLIVTTKTADITTFPADTNYRLTDGVLGVVHKFNYPCSNELMTSCKNRKLARTH